MKVSGNRLIPLLFFALLPFLPLFLRVDHAIYDIYSRLFSPPPDSSILLITIDRETVKRLGKWEIEDSLVVKAVKNLEGAEATGIDLLPGRLLPSPPRDTGKAVVVPVYFMGDEILYPHFPGVSVLLSHNEVLADVDGVVRAISPFRVYKDRAFPSFSMGLFMEGEGIRPEGMKLHRRKLITPKSTLYLDTGGFARFRFTRGDYPCLSFWKLLDGKVKVEGKYVILGYSIMPEGGQFFTPTSRRGIPVPGIIIQANFLDALLNGRFVCMVNSALSLFVFSLLFFSFLYWKKKSSFVFLVFVLLIHPVLFLRNIYFNLSSILVLSSLSWILSFYLENARIFFMLRALYQTIKKKPEPSSAEFLERMGVHVERGEKMETLEELIQGLRAEFERMSEIEKGVESIPYGFMLLSKGGVVYRNRSFDELASRHPEKIREIVGELLEKNEVSEEIELGERRYMVNGFYHPSGFYFLIVFDVTEIVNAARMRELFTSWFSHQARTPLTAIKGYATLLLNDGVRFSEEILREVRRLESLANRFLYYAKFSSGSFEVKKTKVEAERIVKKVIDDLRGFAATYGVEVEWSAEGTIYTDPVLLQEILTNLVENAIKYNRRGGRVEVEVKHGKIRVKDTGPGLPPDYDFTPFYRKGKGYGIGLAFVKKAVEALGGKISFTTSPKGTEFLIEL